MSKDVVKKYIRKNFIDDTCTNKCNWEWTDVLLVRQLGNVSVSVRARSGFIGSIYCQDLKALSLDPSVTVQTPF